MTKKDAIRIVVKCAEQYKENLLDRSLLFILLDNKKKNISSLEVTFRRSNFMHLTGLKVTTIDQDGKGIYASEFFKRCLNHKLSEKDFEFAEDGTSELKLQVLPTLIRSNLEAKMVGFYNNSLPRLYTDQLAGGVNGCMGFREDSKTNCMVPDTVLNCDIRKLTSSTLQVIATYRKYKSDEQYSECVYLAKKIDWAKIKYPEEYNYISMPIFDDKN